MDLDRQRRLADENLVAAFDLVRVHVAHPSGESRQFGSVTAIRTGIDVGFYNPVLALGTGATPDDVLDALDWVADASLPTTAHVSAGNEPIVGQRLLADGLEVDPYATPVMALQPIPGRPPAPPELRIRSGADELFTEWHRAVGESTTLRRVVGPDFMADPAVRVAVGEVDGEPVAHAAAIRSGGTLGVYAVGTVRERRGRGYGRAVTWAVIEAGVAAWNSELAILQSSEAGVPLYGSMGFVEIDRIFEFGVRPATGP
jgi:N-acetylglutamate synthase